jgi:hypothetical protein
MAAGWWQCSAWGGKTRHRRAAQAPETSLMHRASLLRGWLAAWALFCVCCVGAICGCSCHGSGLVAVQRLGRQNAAQAGIAGAGDLTDASGEVNVGLAGRMGADFCAASYYGQVWWKLHVKRYDVDLPSQQCACLASSVQKLCIVLHNGYVTGVCMVMVSWN